MSPTYAPLAVLDEHPELGQILHYPDRRGRVQLQVDAFAQLVYLADVARVFQLWLHPRWLAAHRVANLELAWSVVATDDERRRVAIVAPSLDRRLDSLTAAADGATLVGALRLLEEQLGTWFTATPGRTAEAMIRADLRRRGLHEPVTLPEIFTRRAQEGPFTWIRPLTPEEAKRPFLVAVDKHAAYLVAMGHVELGIGSPTSIAGPAVFDRRLPGYWHVRTRTWTDPRLPDPTRPRGVPGRQEAAEDWRWLTTPSVRAADELGLLLEVGDAYVWTRHSRVLAPFAERLRAARKALDAQTDSKAAAVAGVVLKRLYASMIGRLRMTADRGPDPLRRSDWHDHLVAEARVNLWRNAQQLVDLELAPAAAAIDCWYVPSPTAEPPAGLRIGTGPGEYSVKAAVPLDQVRALFNTRHVRVLADRVAELAQEGQ